MRCCTLEQTPAAAAAQGHWRAAENGLMSAAATSSDARAAAVRRWTLVSAVLGSSMAFMDGTVVNVALPAIQRSLDASGADAQWIIEA
jgi:hypothetical protein